MKSISITCSILYFYLQYSKKSSDKKTDHNICTKGPLNLITKTDCLDWNLIKYLCKQWT